MILSPVFVGGAIGVDHTQTDQISPTSGQTSFVLSQTPVDDADVRMRVNGVSYDNGIEYLVAGTSVTWTGVAFVLKAGDIVEFNYNI